MKDELRGATTTSIRNPNLFQYPAGPAAPQPLTEGLHLATTADSSCIEKLLLHCGAALENSDATHAQQVMWVLNNVACCTGDPNQRLASWFLKALLTRLCPTASIARTTAFNPMTVTELASYIDLTPWHRFGFSASNGAILRAVQGASKIHVLDFGIMHCMQWPTLIDSLSKRPEGPPLMLRITVPAERPPVPPLLTVPVDVIGHRLTNFARSRNLPFELHVVNKDFTCGQLNPLFFDLHDDETVVVNCQGWLRYLSTKDEFLESVRELNPTIVTVTDDDADLDSPNLTARIMACFNYMWIPFDALETFLPKDSARRGEYEADVGQKIENVIRFEGEERIERSESGARIVQRMRRANFVNVPFEEEVVKEVKGLLDEHASGWGMKRDEEMMVLTWKGHSSVFTTAWAPYEFHK